LRLQAIFVVFGDFFTVFSLFLAVLRQKVKNSLKKC